VASLAKDCSPAEAKRCAHDDHDDHVLDIGATTRKTSQQLGSVLVLHCTWLVQSARPLNATRANKRLLASADVRSRRHAVST
jgi:hypothetical protein